jgi:pimeloyl-ACP methyl ester carboxylesterase
MSVLESLSAVGLKSTMTRMVTEQVYRLVIGTSHFAGWLLENALQHIPLPHGEQPATRGQRLMVSSINGAFGDWLRDQNRVWAQTMQFCRDGAPLTLDVASLQTQLTHPRPHVVVFMHGLCLNDLHWQPPGQPGFGGRWEHDGKITAFYGRYNTGLHIHENGRQLALMLERLLQSYPIPIERLTLVGHSMGGLVSRSACSYAQELQLSWLSVLQDVACLGSPHQGAALERIGQWVTLSLDKTRITASLSRAGKQRSAGIKDLRYACLRHEDWQDSHPDAERPLRITSLPLLPSVRYCLLASNWKTATGETLGDGLVQVSSAMAQHLGGHPLETPQVTRTLLQGLHHMELPRHEAIFHELNGWLFSDLQEKGGLLSEERYA